MRAVLIGDLLAAARVLALTPEPLRRRRMRRLVAAARWADRHRRRSGRPHPRFGTGSLMAAAAAWPCAPDPVVCDGDWLACLACAVAVLREVSGCSEPVRGPERGSVPISSARRR